MSGRKLSRKFAWVVACIVPLASFLTAPRAAAQAETVLYSFDYQGRGGVDSNAALILDSSGNLYGTARNGGGSAIDGQGACMVFELSPQAGGGWIYNVLHNFNL